jgi:hypothetical protein
MMTENEIQEFLSNVTFDKIKDLNHHDGFIDLVNLPEVYEAYLYLTIIDSKKEMNKYLGWSGKDFDGTYVGSVVKHREQFLKDLRHFGSRVICLNYGEASIITKMEKNMLDFLNARDNPEYFNATNGGSSKMKGFKSIAALDNILLKYENEEYDIVLELVDTLEQIEPFQVREVMEIKGLCTDISFKLNDSKGKWLDEILLNGKSRHPAVFVLEDFFGKGIHCRIGSYHTIKSSKTCPFVDELRTIYIPKEDWKDLDDTEIKDLGLWDNRKTDDVKSDIPASEAVSNCVEFCQNNKVPHTDERIKAKLRRWNFGSHEISKLIPKMRIKLQVNRVIPIGHQKIDYKSVAGLKILEDKRNEEEDEYTHCLTLDTTHFANNWSEWGNLVDDLTVDENTKKPNWKIWWYSTNDTGHEKWSSRQNAIEGKIKNLVKNFDQKTRKISFYFDNFSYTKKNKIKK